LTVCLSPAPSALQATVYVVEQLGRETLLTVRIAGEIVRAFAPADMQLEAEQTVWLSFREETIHLFDGDTERALSARGEGAGDEPA
jgi:multiple sugar transport system ATP-binding protein